MTDIAIYTLSILVSFSLAFAKAFQTKVIVQGNRSLAFFMSMVITSCEVATVSFVVMTGWWVLLTAGIGGAIGVVCAMTFHRRVFGHQNTAQGVKNVP